MKPHPGAPGLPGHPGLVTPFFSRDGDVTFGGGDVPNGVWRGRMAAATTQHQQQQGPDRDDELTVEKQQDTPKHLPAGRQERRLGVPLKAGISLA